MANLAQMKLMEGLDGFLLVDKPAGIAFASVVKAIKRKFNLVKVGHGGSLDAQASGLVVVLIGDANRFVDRVMGADRAYTGTMTFGATTDTGDAQGRPEAVGRTVPAEELKGDVFLSEPRFAAIRREGTAEYEVVETGEHPEQLGHVYRFEFNGGDFTLKATKGVLPRSLARELGATLVSLRRTEVGRFQVKDAVAFDRLLTLEPSEFAKAVLPLGAALA